jgi:hypothetical protein
MTHNLAASVHQRLLNYARATGRPFNEVLQRFAAYLGKARIPMRIDVGFGDPLVPGPSLVQLPAILDFPPPEVQGYSRESAIAEKYQIMIHLGRINSRMKDFYDIWSLATHFSFEGPTLAQAISETFESRGTPLSLHPVAFSDAFAQDSEKQVQWEAFRRRLGIETVPAGLQEALQTIAAFLYPVTEALVEGKAFPLRWEPGHRWLPGR